MRSIQALEWRYATKRFDPDKLLSKEKVDLLVKAFNLTATSYCLQPLKLLVIRDRELQEKLRKASFNQPQLSTASDVLIICTEKIIGKEFIETYFKYVSDIRKTPETILRPFRENLIDNFEEKPTDEIHIWAMHQAYLVLGSLLTVCAVEEIDSCPMEGFIPEQFDQILGLEELNLHAVLCLPVGYRSEDDHFADLKKVRRPLSDTVIHFNRSHNR